MRTSKISSLFDTPVPDAIEGFKLEDSDKIKMCEVWPEGENVALEVCHILALVLAQFLMYLDARSILEHESAFFPTWRR